MKLNKTMLLSLILAFSTTTFAATQGCNSLTGTWQGNGTVNNKSQLITLRITGMNTYKNWPSGKTYTVSGFLNNIPLTSTNLLSFCSEVLTTEGTSIHLLEFGTNTGLYGIVCPIGNALTPTKLSNCYSGSNVIVNLEKTN